MLSRGLRSLSDRFRPFRETGVVFSAEEMGELVQLLDFGEAEAANLEFRFALFGEHRPIIPMDATGIVGRRP
jgi:hypothetical protein